MPDSRTRKPISALTSADLEAFPIWEYATDEEGEGVDETFVRPVISKVVPGNAFSQIVASDFRTPRSRSFFGFMIVHTAKKIEIDPGALLGRVYLPLPAVSLDEAVKNGSTWVLDERKRLIDELGLLETELFPLAYQLRVLLGKEKAVRNGHVS